MNRLARELVTRGGFSPARTGWRYLPRRPPDQEVLLTPASVAKAPLPLNVSSREELSRDRGVWGISFHDVPEREVAATSLVTMRNARVLTAIDAWGDPHYAIVDRDGNAFDLRGTDFKRPFHARLMTIAPAKRLDRATWVLEQWDRNYSHWLQWHLSKLVLLQKLAIEPPVILPAPEHAASVAAASLAILGVPPCHELREEVLEVGELTALAMDNCPPDLMRGLRDRLSVPGTRSRRIFISRAKAPRRRLTNEDECWETLRSHGFERVFTESLTFDEQRALMSSAEVVVAVHGAGLTNILFAAEGLHVVEISDVTHPSPQFYALASALGHHYWLVSARPASATDAGNHDVQADTGELRDVLAALQKRK